MAAPMVMATRRTIASVIAAITLVLLVVPLQASPAAAQRSGGSGWEARQIRNGVPARDRDLVASLPDRARIGYHPETGRVRFISGTRASPLSGPVAAATGDRRGLSSADARSKARRFVERYGQLFGLAAPGREMRLRSTSRAPAPLATGMATSSRAQTGSGSGAVVRFDQVRDGVAVMGGELVVQLSPDGEVLSAVGEVLPSGAKASTEARIPASRARTAAAEWLARATGRAAAAVVTVSEGLALYDPRLMGDPVLAPDGRRLVWRIDARLASNGTRPGDHRLVLVDARSGHVLTSIARVHSANRRVCDNRTVAGRSFVCRSPYQRVEGQGPSGISDVDAVYRLMGVTFDFFKDRFGRDGIDGKGSAMKATVRYCPSYGCPWRNAEWKWAQQQAVFGRGWAQADDIVAHEFTHGVLDHEAPLFYYFQSGAINESFADVFGELIDLAYSGGTDTSATRWKIGEDTPIGVFRDMRNPTRFGHPDRVGSPKWHTGTSDDGGVHRNSGVGNKAAFLMAAGGRFQGYQVKGIGRDRTARVWYQALTTRMTSAANYIDLYDALNAACTDLAGTAGLTLAHCESVRDATRATQMNLRPRKLAPKSAPVCFSGKRPIDVFVDDLEDPDSGDWSTSRLVGNKKGWFYPQNPNNSPGWDGSWSSSGSTNFYAPNRGSRSDTVMRMTRTIEVPERAFLRFEHGFSFDRDAKRRYDGAIVEVKADGGPWRGVARRFTHGGYNGTIAKGHGNRLAGRRAYTGSSRGWAEARLDLSAFAGQRIKVRFRMASDRTAGARGWYIDDVRIFSCARDDDRPTGDLSIEADAATTTDPAVSLGLTWDDASTWVTKVRVSASPGMNESGVSLRKGVSLPPRESIAWDLSDTTYGGSGKPGPRTVYAQVKDAAGNWSKVFSDSIEWVVP